MENKLCQKLETLVQKTLEIAPHDRDAFLEGACASDEDLRLEVATIISSEQGKNPIKTPPKRLIPRGLIMIIKPNQQRDG